MENQNVLSIFFLTIWITEIVDNFITIITIDILRSFALFYKEKFLDSQTLMSLLSSEFTIWKKPLFVCDSLKDVRTNIMQKNSLFD